MKPELQQDVIGLECGIGCEIGPPVTFGMLHPEHCVDRYESLYSLKLWTHMGAILWSRCPDTINSDGNEKRTSSSLSVTSSRSKKP
jgi:hypothetical protein